MTTPSFFDDLAEKCAKTRFDAENLRNKERDSFKGLLTEMWEKQKHFLAQEAVRKGAESITARFRIGFLNFKAYKPSIFDFRDHLPDELAQASKGKGEKGCVYPITTTCGPGDREEEGPLYACEVKFHQVMAAHLKEWRMKGQEEERDEPAAKKPKPEPKREPKVKDEPM